MSCVPNSKAFTPCQAAAMRNMNPEQQRQFAQAVGLSHLLDGLKQQTAPLNISTPGSYLPPTPPSKLIAAGSLKSKNA